MRGHPLRLPCRPPPCATLRLHSASPTPLNTHALCRISPLIHTAPRAPLPASPPRRAVVLQPPRLADLDAWEGCFITSTSRLLLPVAEVDILPDTMSDSSQQGSPTSSSSSGGASANGSPNGSAGGGAAAPLEPVKTRLFAAGGLVARLEALVLAEVAACSEPLFE